MLEAKATRHDGSNAVSVQHLNLSGTVVSFPHYFKHFVISEQCCSCATRLRVRKSRSLKKSDFPLTFICLRNIRISQFLKKEEPAERTLSSERRSVTRNATVKGIFAGNSPDQANPGATTIITSADVIASGADSVGIGVFGGSASRSTVTVEAGAAVQGGSGSRAFGFKTIFTSTQHDVNNDGIIDFTEFDTQELFQGSAGVLFVGGTNNVLNNAGTISSLNGMAVTAFSGDISNETYDWNNIDWATLGPNEEPARITEVMTFLPTNDTVNNTGTINGNVALGDGVNVASNSSTLNGTLTTGTGADTYENKGTHIGDANLGGGANKFTNYLGSVFSGLFNSGSGSDAIDNAGVINGDVNTGGGDDAIVNTGVMIGSVDMGAGTNSFANNAGAVFNSGATVKLGAGNTMTNAGTLSPGGIDVVATTTLTGNYTQNASGKLVVDIDGTASDKLVVSGAADVAGTVAPNVINLAKIEQGFVIISAGDGAVDSGLGLNSENLTVQDTAGFDFELAFSNNEVTLNYVASSIAEIISQTGTSTGAGVAAANVQAAATVLDNAVVAGADPQLVQLVTALQALPDSAAAAKAVERLIPSNQGAQASGTVSSGANFANAMLSCKLMTGSYRYTREGQCYWAKVTARKLTRDAPTKYTGVSETGFEFTGGIQFAVWDELRLGVRWVMKIPVPQQNRQRRHLVRAMARPSAAVLC